MILSKKLIPFLLIAWFISGLFLSCDSVNTDEMMNNWESILGGNYDDYGYCVQQTGDGGYIITGYTYSLDTESYDVCLFKTDSSGTKVGSRKFGGSNDDYGYSVRQTLDGGYVITGYTESFGAGKKDVYLIKTDSTGDEVWSRTFGGMDDDTGYCVQKTSDGGFIIAGSTYSSSSRSTDVYLIKVDSSGNEQWSRTYDGSDSTRYDCGYSVQQTTDGGYIITGETHSSDVNYSDVYLIKTDSLGYEQWSRTFGGVEDDIGASVQQTSDGGYIIAGTTDDYYSFVYLLKTDPFGTELWSRTFREDYSDVGNSVQQTDGGGYIIAGTTNPIHGSHDVYLIKTDSSGYEQWSRALGGDDYDYGHCVQQTGDGGYIIAGATESPGCCGNDVYLVYFNPAYENQ